MSVRCLSIYLLYTQPSARAVVRVEVEAAAHALPDDLGLVCEGAAVQDAAPHDQPAGAVICWTHEH